MSKPADEQMLEDIQREAFEYFTHETNPKNGLVKDKTTNNWPSSIAATGLGLAAYPVGIERGFITRKQAVKNVLATLRFFRDCKQGPEPDATGYKGFYYHFLNMETGTRAWGSELSTIDSTFLIAGGLMAAAYFTGKEAGESEIRDIAHELYAKADWQWAQNGGQTVTHGWRPESGFITYRWEGYDEALLLYLLGLGSPTHPLPAKSYEAWTSTYSWRKIYGYEYLYAGPLFIHQLSHVWVDFRGIQDAYMRNQNSDYFKNSRLATHVQREYARRNPHRFEEYCDQCWGITASDGPGPASLWIGGVEHTFYDYLARGVPYGPDDGTIAPWAVAASLPFAPDIVLPTLEHFNNLKLREGNPYGFKATFNPTYPEKTGNPYGWISPWHYGLNQGPIVLMLENYRTGLPWELMRTCPYLVAGLRKADFSDGWLPEQ